VLLALAAGVVAAEDAPNDDAKPQADVAATAQNTAASRSAVDFAAEVQPIFTAHCVKCHGSEVQSSGLRLDSGEHAAAGGYTGAPVVGGTLATNEIYRRVSATDRAFRMPKNAAPLAPEEIATIKRWVEHGAHWPADKAVVDRRSRFEQLYESLADFFQRYEYEYAFVQPFAVAFIALQLLLFALTRAKAAHQQNRRWAAGRFGRFASSLSSREMALIWLCLAGGIVLVVLRAHQLQTDVRLARLEAINVRNESPWSKTVFGYPPVPIRPDHPKQLAGTYYRGNCERNKELFNGGNYLTATFHIKLCDQGGKALTTGDAVPESGLFVDFEIVRAPGTPDQLFDEKMMATVFFSEDFFDPRNQESPRDELIRLEMVEDGQRWHVRIPLRAKLQGDSLAGLIYLYMGRITPERVEGTPSYAIKYDLVITDNHVDAQSDLWMSSFNMPPIAPPTPAGHLPFTEWFDYRPIPPITGENTKDPKLLGVQDYIDKGLLPPDAAQPKATTQPEK
jgi:mono/diheme cytochrome c family protein